MQRGPMPITPSEMVSLGATAPPLPNTAAGTIDRQSERGAGSHGLANKFTAQCIMRLVHFESRSLAVIWDENHIDY